MQKLWLICCLFSISFVASAQKKPAKQEIIELLDRQNKYWNEGNIEAFMQDYWQSDSLMFIGKNGVVYGWEATRSRYLKSYPDRATMGKLRFEIQKIDFHSKNVAWVLGKWQLLRPEKGDVGGFFTLILKKINGRWFIVSDHTS